MATVSGSDNLSISAPVRGLVNIVSQSGSGTKRKFSIAALPEKRVRSVDMIPAAAMPSVDTAEVIAPERIYELGEEKCNPGYAVPICEASEETFKEFERLFPETKGYHTISCLDLSTSVEVYTDVPVALLTKESTESSKRPSHLP